MKNNISDEQKEKIKKYQKEYREKIKKNLSEEQKKLKISNY